MRRRVVVETLIQATSASVRKVQSKKIKKEDPELKKHNSYQESKSEQVESLIIRRGLKMRG